MVGDEFKMLTIGKRYITHIYINYPDYIDKIRSTFEYENRMANGLDTRKVYMDKYNKFRNMFEVKCND
jgi:hypothetical protein